MNRPILFSAAMVLAILAGRKTQTRRLVKPGPGQKWLTPETIAEVRRFAPSGDGWWTMAVGEPRRVVHCGHEIDGGHIGSIRCPYYREPGDRLWVRETWATLATSSYGDREIVELAYRADDGRRHRHVTLTGEQVEPYYGARFRSAWRPSIHMPRWASRITLDVSAVRVERLHEITEKDAAAEGCQAWETTDGRGSFVRASAREEFEALWGRINGPESWDANPWVWVISFTRAAEVSRAA